MEHRTRRLTEKEVARLTRLEKLYVDIAALIVAEPKTTYRTIAERIGCSLRTVKRVAEEFNIQRRGW